MDKIHVEMIFKVLDIKFSILGIFSIFYKVLGILIDFIQILSVSNTYDQ